MIKIISCRLFETYIKDMLDENYDVVYLDVQLHNSPKKLRRLLQEEIDQTQGYDKILLLYGLCGNVLLDIHANDIPIYVLKVHDCLSILLGGHQRFLDEFEDRKSSSWTCKGLLENKAESNLKDYMQWIIDYGEEEADYLKSILCPPCSIYINVVENDLNTDYPEIIVGDMTYLKEILSLSHKDMLVLYKGDKLKLTNNHNVIEKYGIG